MNKKIKKCGIVVAGIIITIMFFSFNNYVEEQARIQEEERIKAEEQAKIEQQQAEEEARQQAEEEAKKEQKAIERIKNNPPTVIASGFINDGKFNIFGNAVHMDRDCWFFKEKTLGMNLEIISGSADEEVFEEATFCPMCCPDSYPNSNLGIVFNK